MPSESNPPEQTSRIARLNVDRDAQALVAERAESWWQRMKVSPDKNDRQEFLRWLKESPMHVREILLATAWEHVLEHMLDPDCRIDVNALMRRYATDTPRKPRIGGGG